MFRFHRLLLFCALAAACPGQMTTDQKINDFLNLAGLYAKNYAPYEWKRDVFGFDLLEAGPWLDRVRASRDDLEFYDICVEYVAALRCGGHDRYVLPSTFSASLGFTVDIYDNLVLIDSISRQPPGATLRIGDELVSVDGKPVEDLIRELEKYGIQSQPLSARRAAAAVIPSRSQNRIPRAAELGERAEVVIRRAGGALETISIPWIKSGMPLTAAGPVPMSAPRAAGLEDGPESVPDYMLPLLALQHVEMEDRDLALNSGGRSPIFQAPAGFAQRMGRAAADTFFSGTYTASGVRIGFIRIPTMSPPNASLAYQQFETEMAYFEQNTDGLVVDVMRNPGGQVNYVEQLCRRLIPTPFRTIGFEIRATSTWVASFAQSLTSARQQNAPEQTILQLENLLKELETANSENRGRTGPMPLGGLSLTVDPLRDRDGRIIAYTKPLIVLADEFSASGGDMFPAVIQDNRRGPIVGMRTMGLGGSVSNYPTGAFAEGATRVTQSLMIRKEAVVTSGYPAAPYVENIGVWPDVTLDYMTRENLLNGGAPFVQAFTAVIVDRIRAGR